MKYSALAPIRSKNEVYTPFSGIRSRKPLHTRAQSETPTPSRLITAAMGIQCDSSEFLSTLAAENQVLIPTITLSVNRRAISMAKQRTRIQKTESKMWVEDSNDDERCATPSGESMGSVREGTHLLNKVHFSKVGDWNEACVLRSKNSSGNYQQVNGYQIAKILVRKPCKIVEFSASILNQPKIKSVHHLPWQYKFSDKGIVNLSGIHSLQKRNKLNNKAKS